MRIHRYNFLGASLLVAGLICAPVGFRDIQAQVPATAAEEVVADAPAARPQAVDSDTEMLKINGETMTLADLLMLQAVRPASQNLFIEESEIARMRGDLLADLGRQYGVHDLLAKAAEEKAITLTEEELKSVEESAERFAQALLFQEAIVAKVAEPTEEQLKARYEAERETKFKREETIRMRHVFVSTYVDYEVKPGDTLESIAREFAGDESLADRILSDTTKRPRAEGLEMENPEANTDLPGGTLDPRALVEGEMLKVPVAGEKEKAAKDRIDEAYAALESGRNFMEVATEYSENEQPGRLFIIMPDRQEKAIMDEIREAFLALEDAGFSKPIRTKHGFQIVYREGYQPTEYIPFEEVRERLLNETKQEQIRTLIDEFFAAMVGDPQVVVVDYKSVSSDAAATPDEAIVVTIGEQEFSYAQFKSAFPQSLEELGITSEDELRARIARAPAYQAAMVETYVQMHGYRERPEVEKSREVARRTMLGREYLDMAARENAEPITEEDLKAEYEARSHEYNLKETYGLYAMVAKGDEATAKAELKELLNGVQNVADFREAATQVNPADDPRFQSDPSFLGFKEVDDIPESDIEAIRATTVPGLTEILYRDGEAIAYWIQSSQEAKQTPFEEVEATLRERLEGQELNVKRREIFDDYLRQVEIELLID